MAAELARDAGCGGPPGPTPRLTRRRVGRRLAYPSPPSVRRRGRGVAFQSLRHIPSPPGLLSTIDTRRVLCRTAYTADCNCSLYFPCRSSPCVCGPSMILFMFVLLSYNRLLSRVQSGVHPRADPLSRTPTVSQNTGTRHARSLLCVYVTAVCFPRGATVCPDSCPQRSICPLVLLSRQSPRLSSQGSSLPHDGAGVAPTHAHTCAGACAGPHPRALSLSLMHRTLIVRLQSGA